MALTSPWSRLVALSLASRGWSVHVLDLTAPEASEYMDADQHRAAEAALAATVSGVHRPRGPGGGLSQVVWSARAVRRVARANDIDVVLTLYGGAHAFAAFLSGVRPYVVYVVGSDVLLADRLRRVAARVALGRAARVFANGAHLARRAGEIAPRARVENLYLGIDLQRFHPGAHASLRPVFVCTRVFRPVYDNATIVRALGRLRDVPADFRMVFVSAGQLLGETRALANSVIPLAWRHQVEFRGWTPDEVFAGTLRAASFYLSASHSDGASSSLLEAMATGLLPIVSDIPANAEWIEDGVNGLLFPPGDDAALADCIRRALAPEPWMRSALSRNRALIAERADVNTSMTRLLDALRAHAASAPRVR